MKTLSQVYLLIAGFLLVYFSYQAFITTPSEGDSVVYHLPIANNILKGKWGNFEAGLADEPAVVNSLLQYYPASSHVILAGLVAIQAPQFFNVLGLVILGGLSWRLGLKTGLKRPTASVFAVSVITLTALIRLVSTQTIDVWVAAWFVGSLLALVGYQPGYKMAIRLGFCLGMLVGTKFTGPLFAAVLVGVFAGRLPWLKRPKEMLTIGLVAGLFGGFWYLRNFITRGNFFYPVNHPFFHLNEWHTWQTLLMGPKMVGYFLQSLFSEYGIWALGLVVLPWVGWQARRNQLLSSLVIVSWLSFGIHLFLPSFPVNLLSDLRYAAPAFITAMLVLFKFAEEHGYVYELSLITICQLLSVLSLKVAHQPKLFGGYALVILASLWVKKTVSQKITR